ncbi:hypothetical protein [Candidatus Kuenenia sp.]|uniref:hypothetical protein n=1 Tax=Candidatus Kuenenia sp. TaxID=2499824 RepID=UPI0032205CFB
MKKNEVERLFKKLELKTRSTGHNYGWLTVNDKKILRVHYSHGKGEIPDKIVSKIRGQLKLYLKDFKDLIDCSLNYNNYINILKQKGIID